MATELDILKQLYDAIEKQGKVINDLCKMISGDPFDPNDTGMKGSLLGATKELEGFNAADHRANTQFREQKEAEMSRLWVGAIILIGTGIVTLMVNMLVNRLTTTGGL